MKLCDECLKKWKVKNGQASLDLTILIRHPEVREHCHHEKETEEKKYDKECELKDLILSFAKHFAGIT